MSPDDAKYKGIWELTQRFFPWFTIHEERAMSNLTDPREKSSEKKIM